VGTRTYIADHVLSEWQYANSGVQLFPSTRSSITHFRKLRKSTLEAMHHHRQERIRFAASRDGTLSVDEHGEWVYTTPAADITPNKWLRVTTGTSVREKRRPTEKHY
jgi:hypothetical protein